MCFIFEVIVNVVYTASSLCRMKADTKAEKSCLFCVIEVEVNAKECMRHIRSNQIFSSLWCIENLISCVDMCSGGLRLSEGRGEKKSKGHQLYTVEHQHAKSFDAFYHVFFAGRAP